MNKKPKRGKPQIIPETKKDATPSKKTLSLVSKFKSVLVLFVTLIAIFILSNSIIIYFSLDAEAEQALNQHKISNRIVLGAYRFKIYATLLINYIPRYQDDLNNTMNKSSIMYEQDLDIWFSEFDRLKTQADSTLAYYKRIINSISKPNYYNKYIYFFDDTNKHLQFLIEQLKNKRYQEKPVKALEIKYHSEFYKLTEIYDGDIIEFSVQKTLERAKHLNVPEKKAQQIQNILLSIITLFFIYTTVFKFDLAKRT